MICFENPQYGKEILDLIHKYIKETKELEKKVIIINVDSIFVFDFRSCI